MQMNTKKYHYIYQSSQIQSHDNENPFFLAPAFRHQ